MSLDALSLHVVVVFSVSNFQWWSWTVRCFIFLQPIALVALEHWHTGTGVE